MKSYKLCHYAVALGKHAKHSKTRLCEASLASCQTQKPFPAISGTLHSRDNQNISRLTRKPSTIMVVKIPHCVISRNIQQSTHHRDCKTKPFLLMHRAQRMQASIHDGESMWKLCDSVMQFIPREDMPWKDLMFSCAEDSLIHCDHQRSRLLTSKKSPKLFADPQRSWW